MTDCSQLPTELADAEQQRDALPKNPIQYCQENSDNLQEYKACLRGLRQQAWDLDQQISALSNSIELCDALTGAWTIHSTNPIADGQQFTITTWDTQCKLFHSMRHFFDNYLTYITVPLSKVKGSESACKGLSVVSVGHKQYAITSDNYQNLPSRNQTIYILKDL